MTSIESETETVSPPTTTTTTTFEHEKRRERLVSSLFLFSLTGVSVLGGFGLALSRSRKSDPSFFEKGLTPGGGIAAGTSGEGLVPGSLPEEVRLAEDGTRLAVRALKRATLYAVGGFSAFCFLGWKLVGAKDLEEFRAKVGRVLPRIPRNNPPQSRTEFSGLNDLLQYVIDEDEKKKKLNQKCDG